MNRQKRETGISLGKENRTDYMGGLVTAEVGEQVRGGYRGLSERKLGKEIAFEM